MTKLIISCVHAVIFFAMAEFMSDLGYNFRTVEYWIALGIIMAMAIVGVFDAYED